MSTLHLVRHGQASFGSEDYDRLSATGRRQVALLAEHWRSLEEPIHAVYSGRMLRQRHTAEPLLQATANGGSAPRLLAGLDEYDHMAVLAAYGSELQREAADRVPGREELMGDPRAFQRYFSAATRRWVAGRLGGDGLEPWPAFQSRVLNALRQAMADCGRGSNVVLATSAGVIAVALQHVLGLSDDVALGLSWNICNTSVTRFAYDGERVTLVCFNAVPHLERAGYRQLVTYR